MKDEQTLEKELEHLNKLYKINVEDVYARTGVYDPYRTAWLQGAISALESALEKDDVNYMHILISYKPILEPMERTEGNK